MIIFITTAVKTSNPTNFAWVTEERIQPLDLKTLGNETTFEAILKTVKRRKLGL
jgi:hypothetical protein